MALPTPWYIPYTKITKGPRDLSPRSPLFLTSYAEVRTGFEPAYNGFANRCLTTWLPHLA
jgi:hypothetical protein